MNFDVSELVIRLADTPWSVALRESLYLYSCIETVHVVTLTLFIGLVMMLDIRLLGLGFRSVPVSQFTSRLLPWATAGFFLMFVSGALLFYAVPVRTFHSIWFRFKVIFLLVSALNVLNFHLRLERDRGRWDRLVKPPHSVRVTAVISLLTWTLVIVMGRLIAYEWFDCGNSLSEWVSWFAQCPS